MPGKPKEPTAAWRLKVGMVTPWLFAAFVIGGLIQVFLAGYGIENLGAQGMEYHGFFGGAVLHLLPLIIALVGFLGADWRAGVGGVVLMVQFELQFALLGGTYAPVLALHALNGVLMVVLATAFFFRRLPWAKKSVAAPASVAAPRPMVSLRPAAPPLHTPNTPRPPTPPQR